MRTNLMILGLIAAAIFALPYAATADETDETAPAVEAVTKDTPEEVPVEAVDLDAVPPGRMPIMQGPALPLTIGIPVDHARMLLRAYKVRTEMAYVAEQLVGKVIIQDPRPGKNLAPGEMVTLVVGTRDLPTPDHRGAPDVMGMPAGNAVAAVKKAGFVPVLRTAPTLDSKKGLVILHYPLAGSLTAPGSQMVLVLGRGGIAAPKPVEIETPPPPPVELEPPVEPEPPVMPEPPVAPEPPVMPEPPVAPEPPSEPPAMPEPPAAPSGVVEAPAMPEPPVEPEPPAPPPVVKPAAASLFAPAESSSFPRAFGSTFQWRPVAGATAYEWELQVEARDGTWSTVTTETVETNRFRPTRMETGRFRWRVRAMKDDLAGDWSEFFRLFMY